MPERTGATVPDELWDRVFRAIDRADALPEDRRARAIRDALADLVSPQHHQTIGGHCLYDALNVVTPVTEIAADLVWAARRCEVALRRGEARPVTTVALLLKRAPKRVIRRANVLVDL